MSISVVSLSIIIGFLLLWLVVAIIAITAVITIARQTSRINSARRGVFLFLSNIALWLGIPLFEVSVVVVFLCSLLVLNFEKKIDTNITITPITKGQKESVV